MTDDKVRAVAIKGRAGRLSPPPDGTIYVRDQKLSQIIAIYELIEAYQREGKDVPQHLLREPLPPRPVSDIILVDQITGLPVGDVQLLIGDTETDPAISSSLTNEQKKSITKPTDTVDGMRQRAKSRAEAKAKAAEDDSTIVVAEDKPSAVETVVLTEDVKPSAVFAPAVVDAPVAPVESKTKQIPVYPRKPRK